MAVHLFYNPDLVGQLAACGIGARRQPSPGSPASGFVLEGRRGPPRAREAVTNVIAVRSGVTITGPRQESAGHPTSPARSAATSNEPRTALELIEECARLRRDNQRLADEVARLTGEIARLIGAGGTEGLRNQQNTDDAATRFSLLELDL